MGAAAWCTVALLSGLLRVCAALAAEVTAPGPASPPSALTLTTAGASLVVASWLSLTTLLALVECLPGRAGHTARRLGRRLTPGAARRGAAVLLGLSLGGALWPGSAVAGAPVRGAVETTMAAAPDSGPTGPAAGGGHSFAWTHSGPSWSPSGHGAPPGPGWTPSYPVARALPSPNLLSSSPGRGVPAADEVVVRRGDTLWGIAARHLGPDASTWAIAAAWPRWYAANRTLIGPDPDLILPGQRLRSPSVS
jgi:hypothetical protein